MADKLEQKFVNPVFYWIIVANFPGSEWETLVGEALKGAGEDTAGGGRDEPLL